MHQIVVPVGYVTNASIGCKGLSGFEEYNATRVAARVQRNASTVMAFTGQSPATFASASRAASLDERCAANRANALLLSSSVVTPDTAVTYLSGWKHWLAYCSEFAYDISLQSMHSHYIPSPYPFRVTIFMEFLSWLVHKPSDPVCGATACNYLAAVRHGYLRNHWGLAEFSHYILTSTRSALHVLDRALGDRNSKKTLPFTHEMRLTAKSFLSIVLYLDRALLLAIEMGLTFLLRKGELVNGTESNDHFLRASDVFFDVCDPISGIVTTIVSSDASMYCHCVVQRVTFSVRSAKNDQDGDGFPYSLCTSPVSDSCAFCVVTNMWEWAIFASPLPHLPFLSWSRGAHPASLQYPAFLAFIKRVAAESGFDPKRFGTHSLRIGGVAILHAMGKDNLFIKEWGRWKSMAFLEYIQWSLVSMESARAAIANPCFFSNADLFQLHPTARLVSSVSLIRRCA